MKAVIYARYSSDKQSDASIEDQIRNCERYVERSGGDYVITECFADRKISGSIRLRPEYQRMLKAAEAKQFKLLLVDDLSRLARDDIEMKSTLRRFKFWGIRVIGVSDAYDSDSKGNKIQAGMRGLMNEIYLDDLRDKTHRGMTGKALKGLNCGGRTYGYKNVPIVDPSRSEMDRNYFIAGKKVIDPEQAKVVLRIFEWYADGYTSREIAHFLNKEGIKSPRGSTWAASAIYGHNKTGTGLLSNELYIGRQVWNRSQWVKDPDTGNRKRIIRPQEEWVTTESDDLRIVPQDVWDRVKERQQQQHIKSEKLRAALHEYARTGAGPKYLLSGLLKCGVCGGSYIVTDSYRYGCATYNDRGKYACPNNKRVKRSLIENRLLTVIKHHLFTPEGIDIFRKEVAKHIALKQKSQQPDMQLLNIELKRVEADITGIMNAIKLGIVTETTKAALLKAEKDKGEILRKLKITPPPVDNMAIMLPRVVDGFQEMVANLDTYAQSEVSKLRRKISALVGEKIVLKPENEDSEHLTAEVSGDYAGLLQAFENKGKLSLVAGAGFEPAAFRL